MQNPPVSRSCKGAGITPSAWAVGCLVQQAEAQAKPSSELLNPLHLFLALPNSCCCPLILFPPLSKPDFIFCLFLSYLEFLWSLWYNGVLVWVHSADNCTAQDLQILVLHSFKWYNRAVKDRATLFTAFLRKMWEEALSAEAVVRRTEMLHKVVPQTSQTRGGQVFHLRKAILKKKGGWQIPSSADVLSSLLKGSRHTHYWAELCPP